MAPKRTALLIRCSADEISRIRESARSEHRTMNGYLLHVLERRLWIEEKFHSRWPDSLDSSEIARAENMRGGRVGFLFRCSVDEADRIRRGASRRRMSISAFVLFSLRRHWHAVEQLHIPRLPGI